MRIALAGPVVIGALLVAHDAIAAPGSPYVDEATVIPLSGAVSVPTNAHLFYSGYAASLAIDGQEASLDPGEADETFVGLPLPALSPNAAHTLVLVDALPFLVDDPPLEHTLTIETADGDDVVPPVLSNAVLRVTNEEAGTVAVSLDVADDVQLVCVAFFVAGDRRTFPLRLSENGPVELEGTFEDDEEIEVRAADAAGNVAGVVLERPREPEEEATGCAGVSTKSPGLDLAVALALLGFAVPASRRRRATR